MESIVGKMCMLVKSKSNLHIFFCPEVVLLVSVLPSIRKTNINMLVRLLLFKRKYLTTSTIPGVDVL